MPQLHSGTEKHLLWGIARPGSACTQKTNFSWTGFRVLVEKTGLHNFFSLDRFFFRTKEKRRRFSDFSRRIIYYRIMHCGMSMTLKLQSTCWQPYMHTTTQLKQINKHPLGAHPSIQPADVVKGLWPCRSHQILLNIFESQLLRIKKLPATHPQIPQEDSQTLLLHTVTSSDFIMHAHAHAHIHDPSVQPAYAVKCLRSCCCHQLLQNLFESQLLCIIKLLQHTHNLLSTLTPLNCCTPRWHDEHTKAHTTGCLQVITLNPAS